MTAIIIDRGINARDLFPYNNTENNLKVNVEWKNRLAEEKCIYAFKKVIY
jgi:hypothetical protein